jgi:hypothetical protein
MVGCHYNGRLTVTYNPRSPKLAGYHYIDTDYTTDLQHARSAFEAQSHLVHRHIRRGELQFS